MLFKLTKKSKKITNENWSCSNRKHYDKKTDFSNNSNVKYAMIRFYNLLYFIQTLRKWKILYDRWKINNCRQWKYAQNIPRLHIERVRLELFSYGELRFTLLGFNPSSAGPSGRYPNANPPSKITGVGVAWVKNNSAWLVLPRISM